MSATTLTAPTALVGSFTPEAFAAHLASLPPSLPAWWLDRKPMAKTLLSKSTYVQGLQCQKLLWFRYNAKDQLQQPGSLAQAIFDQGHAVGDWAKRRFPDGLEIGVGTKDFDKVIAETQRQLALRKPLFEPAFRAAGGYARLDILNPVDEDAWDIIEVKSSTSVKDVYLELVGADLQKESS